MKKKYGEPKACNLDSGAIASFAEQVASTMGFDPGADIEALVNRLNGKIEYCPPNEDLFKVASITVEKEGAFIIRLSALLFPLQKRFSIAHELGHLFLHSRYGEYPLEAYHNLEKENTQVESEADEFACALLMPSKIFKSVVSKLGKDSTNIAAFFMVPEPLVRQKMNHAE